MANIRIMAEDGKINGFEVPAKDKYCDLSVSYLPEYDKNYFLLYVVHSSGDSSGPGPDETQYIYLYPVREDAIRAARAIRAHQDEYVRRGEVYDSNHKLELVLKNGVLAKVHTPWQGYFERLEKIHVQTVRLNSDLLSF